MKKYSTGFNKTFNFFLINYRKQILDFCGSIVEVKFNINSQNAKESFKLFENGGFKNKEIESSQPNILKAVIIDKKAWGLWKTEYARGIAEGLFNKEEILSQFIEIPDKFLLEFNNEINKFKYQ